MTRWIVALLVVAIGGYGLYAYFDADTASSGSDTASSGNALVAVDVPDLSGAALAGEGAFNAKCARCHGTNAAGQDGVAPPLIHKIYEPGHHGDMAFVMAARQGVRQHHWPFGNMPPVEGITDAEIAVITAYIRAVQRANGIN